MSKKDTLILGLGNTLMGDDGAGIIAVREIAKERLPKNVEVMDGGTPGVDAIGLIKKYKRVIIIDAAMGGKEILKLKAIDVADKSAKFSLHGVDLQSTLTLMKTLGEDLSGVEIIAIPIKNASPGMEISKETAANVERAVHLITNEILRSTP